MKHPCPCRVTERVAHLLAKPRSREIRVGETPAAHRCLHPKATIRDQRYQPTGILAAWQWQYR